MPLEPAGAGVGAIQHQVSRQQFAERRMVSGADPISRTAVYVTHMHGGVGGGGGVRAPYPDWAASESKLGATNASFLELVGQS